MVQLRVCMKRARCVSRVGRKLGMKFKVDVGLRQRSVMSSCLFNIFID
jgi:hypothetical protein